MVCSRCAVGVSSPQLNTAQSSSLTSLGKEERANKSKKTWWSGEKKIKIEAVEDD